MFKTFLQFRPILTQAATKKWVWIESGLSTGYYDEDWRDRLSIIQWFIDCTTAGCKMKQNNDTKLSMSVSDAVNGENVIADDQDFDWNVLNSDSVLGAYQ